MRRDEDEDRNIATHKTSVNNKIENVRCDLESTRSGVARLSVEPSTTVSSSPSSSLPSSSSLSLSAVGLQEKLNNLDAQVKDFSDELKRLKDMGVLIRDCKLKFQQIKKKEDQIDEFAKEEDSDEIIDQLMNEKKKCLQIIAQNKKQIEKIDKNGKVARRLLSSASDCDEGINFIIQHSNSISESKNTYDKEIQQLQAELKLAMVSNHAGGGEGFNLKFEGEWQHDSSLHQHAFMRQRISSPASHSFSRYLSSLSSHPSISVKHCDIVHNPDHLRLFHGAIDTIEKRQKSGIFNADLSSETNPDQRKEILKKLKSSHLLAKHNRGEDIMVIGAFHGTTAEKAESIISTGFANLATLDEGWYGKGIYFTTHPDYATQYCKKAKNPCLIFCYVILANPFPIIHADAPSSSQLRFQGKSNHKNYGCHYIPVVHYRGLDYRPPDLDKLDAPQFNEVVIFQETHILPNAIIYLDIKD